MFRLVWLSLLGVFAAVFLSSCASGIIPTAPELAMTNGTQAAAEEYRLGVADKVRVTVFGEEALTGEFTVGSNGTVSMPLIGETQAAGLTIGQFQEGIAQALRQGYITEPRVSAEIMNYRPFYILGEVKTPGTYPFTNDLTVLNAVATAGGFTYRADIKTVFIKHGEAGAEEQFPLTSSTRVEPGDTIRIRERFF
ncbi:polysaccharide biosynthesis/export family protein [soil metagenome]